MTLEMIRVMTRLKITVAQLKRASCQQYQNIMPTVPAMVKSPEARELRDWEMMLERFSTSLVMRLMMSPWGWLSRYLTGRFTTFWNSSPRIRRTTRWLSRAAVRFCRRLHPPWSRYVPSIRRRNRGRSP